jgi:hypothetical protein
MRPTPDVRAWAAGAEGELIVGDHLASLPDWVVLHDRRAPSGGNIDHVAIGPAGLWVIETKHGRGRVDVDRRRVRLNGRPVDRVIDQVWREAVDVGRLVRRPGPERSPPRQPSALAGPRARPVLCVVGAEVIRRADPSGGFRHGPVEIHTPESLVVRLRTARSVLSEREVIALAQRLDRCLGTASGDPGPDAA